MKRLSSTYLILILAAAAFVVAAALPTFLYMRIHSAQAYVAQVQTDIFREGLKEKQTRLLKQQALATVEQRASLAELRVAKDDAAGFITKVEGQARAAKVQLNIGAVALSDEATGGLKTLSIQMSAEGSRSGVMKFLQLIETMPQATNILSASLEQREKTWVVGARLTVPIQI